MDHWTRSRQDVLDFLADQGIGGCCGSPIDLSQRMWELVIRPMRLNWECLKDG